MGEQHQRPADLGHRAADGIERDEDAVSRALRIRRTVFDEPQFVDQAAIAIGEIDEARGRALRRQRSVQAIDQPGAEGVQPFKFLQIDVDAARLLVAAGGVLDDLLKLGGTLGGPGTARRERYAFAPTLASPACGGG